MYVEKLASRYLFTPYSASEVCLFLSNRFIFLDYYLNEPFALTLLRNHLARLNKEKPRNCEVYYSLGRH